MDDIEDIVGVEGLSLESKDNSNKPQLLQVHGSQAKSKDDVAAAEEAVGLVPGVEKVWMQTFGCAHNISDGEYMKGALKTYGYTVTDKREDAQVWVINSCTVKDPSQASFMRVVTEGKDKGKGVVVAGCVPQADRKLKGLEDVSMIGVSQIENIVSVVEDTAKGNTVKMLGKAKALPSLSMPKIRKNRLIEIVPVSTGCLGSCTYCKTKHARGKLGSYTLEALETRIKNVLQEGEVREIWLASEDTGAYGRDLGTNIAELLKRLCKTVEQYGSEETMLRLGMTNPPYMMAHLDQIAEALRHQNVFKFLHIPVQSGSDNVLEGMNREYTCKEFRRVCDFLLKYVPGMTIATDIICGFPGETEEDFQETMQLVKDYKFPVLNISKFYARPGTPAAKMKRVPTEIAKRRSKELTELFESYTCYEKYIGQTVPVWFSTEIGKNKAEMIEQSVGHTREYIKTVVPRDDSLIGKKALVKIESASKFHLSGYVI
mmetsp:Transcript_12150/g.15747  ORF Transcript_12150/g.15747 Transcript_12150/m.15747 type:complete len:487 (+) Transcript_12150:61-1521(+)